MHYNGANSYLFVKGVEIYKFEAKVSEINAALLRLGKLSKEFSTDNMKKTGLYQYVYDFLVDFDSIDILDIHKCLTKKHDIK